MFSKNFNQQIIKIEMSASSVYNNDKSTRKAVLNSTITKCQHRNRVGHFIAREDVLDSNQMRSSHPPKRNRVYPSARFQVTHPLELTEGMPPVHQLYVYHRAYMSTRILARPQIERVRWTFRVFHQSFLDNVFVFTRTE